LHQFLGLWYRKWKEKSWGIDMVKSGKSAGGPIREKGSSSLGGGNISAAGENPIDPQVQKLLFAFIDRYRNSTLGALLKGIVHNLNGSLQILSMQMELLQRTLPPKENRVQEQMEKCLGQIDKFKGMLDLLIQKGVHDEQDIPQNIHLNELLEEELALLHHNLFCKHQVQIHKDFSFPLPPLKGCYLDFSQGLSNLIQNALEAMEQSSRKELTLKTQVKGDQVQVIIKDTGYGIPEDLKPHLFKPFFSNKGGKHQGVGLYITRELLAQYGASFRCSSKKGETIFEISFPTKLTSPSKPKA
jgi:signal transduction histidine kinase